MWYSKEQLKRGKSGRNWKELEVIPLLRSRLLEEEEEEDWLVWVVLDKGPLNKVAVVC